MNPCASPSDQPTCTCDAGWTGNAFDHLPDTSYQCMMRQQNTNGDCSCLGDNWIPAGTLLRRGDLRGSRGSGCSYLNRNSRAYCQTPTPTELPTQSPTLSPTPAPVQLVAARQPEQPTRAAAVAWLRENADSSANNGCRANLAYPTYCGPHGTMNPCASPSDQPTCTCDAGWTGNAFDHLPDTSYQCMMRQQNTNGDCSCLGDNWIPAGTPLRRGDLRGSRGSGSSYLNRNSRPYCQPQ